MPWRSVTSSPPRRYARRAGRLEEAVVIFERTTVVSPHLAKAWVELGVTALQAGRNRQALAALTRAVELQPDSVLAWFALGNARRADGDPEAAEGAFRKAVALAPGHGAAWVNLGVVVSGGDWVSRPVLVLWLRGRNMSEATTC